LALRAPALLQKVQPQARAQVSLPGEQLLLGQRELSEQEPL
jgi:hypothetical protein